MIASGPLGMAAPYAGRYRFLSGLVGSDGLLEVLEPKLQLVRGQLLGAAAKLVARQTLDQQPQLVVLGVQGALLQQHRPQHLLQFRGVVGQGVGIDLHDADCERPCRVAPSAKVASSAGKVRPGARDGRPPLTPVEKRGQLRRRQRNAASRRRRWPRKLTPFQPLGQHAQAHSVMPKQLDQPGFASAKRVKRAVKRVRVQALLDQHRQADHALAHIGHPAGKVDTAARRQPNHRLSSAPSTRRSARPSTWASTRSDTPPGSTISISPSGRGGDGGSADGRAIGVRSGVGGGPLSSTAAKRGIRWVAAEAALHRLIICRRHV